MMRKDEDMRYDGAIWEKSKYIFWLAYEDKV